jgi:hypothetical protein
MSHLEVIVAELAIEETPEVEFSLGNREVLHRCQVCSLPTEVQGIFGTDFMKKKTRAST